MKAIRLKFAHSIKLVGQVKQTHDTDRPGIVNSLAAPLKLKQSRNKIGSGRYLLCVTRGSGRYLLCVTRGSGRYLLCVTRGSGRYLLCVTRGSGRYLLCVSKGLDWFEFKFTLVHRDYSELKTKTQMNLDKRNRTQFTLISQWCVYFRLIFLPASI